MLRCYGHLIRDVLLLHNGHKLTSFQHATSKIFHHMNEFCASSIENVEFWGLIDGVFGNISTNKLKSFSKVVTLQFWDCLIEETISIDTWFPSVRRLVVRGEISPKSSMLNCHLPYLNEVNYGGYTDSTVQCCDEKRSLIDFFSINQQIRRLRLDAFQKPQLIEILIENLPELEDLAVCMDDWNFGASDHFVRMLTKRWSIQKLFLISRHTTADPSREIIMNVVTAMSSLILIDFKELSCVFFR